MKNIVIFSFVGILAIILGFLQFDYLLIDLYTKTVFYFHSITLFFWIICFFKVILFNNEGKIEKEVFYTKIKSFFEYHWFALILSVLLMILGIFACKPDFRILADETNLVSDSQTLYEKRECYIVYSSLNRNLGEKRLIRIGIDKRPAFFPYFLSLVHTVLGYKAENVFILNFIFGVLSLFLIYYLIQIYKGRFWGICGLCCLSAYPIFLLYANSAGFDLFNMFCSLVLLVLIYKFIEQRKASFAEVLLLWLPIIGQSRYESILSVFIVLPLIFYWLPKSEYSKLTYKTWLFPLLLLPSAWLFRITNDPSFWQVDKLEEGFGLNWLCNNTIQAFVFFLSGEEAYGIIPILSILGIIGFIIFVLDIFRKETNLSFGCLDTKSTRLFVVAFLLFYFLHSIAKFSYSWTDFTDVIISRQSLIFLPFIVIMAIHFLSECNKKYGLKKSYCALSAIFLVFIYWPDAGNNCGVKTNELYNEFKEGRKYLQAYFPNKKDYICIVERPGLFVPLGYSAISLNSDLPNANNKNPDKTKEEYKNNNLKLIVDFYKRKICSYFILIQNIDKKTKEPLFALPDGFKEEVLCEYQFFPERLLRFSKITITD